MQNSQKLDQEHIKPQNRKPSNCEEVVGNKTSDQLDASWIAHFRQKIKTGRPDGIGWKTAKEMAVAAKTNHQTINRYIKENKDMYESEKGTIDGHRTTFHRFKGKVSVSALSGNRR